MYTGTLSMHASNVAVEDIVDLQEQPHWLCLKVPMHATNLLAVRMYN